MITENIALKPYNTFRIQAFARQFSIFPDADALLEVLSDPRLSKTGASQPFVLGGGSNILLTKDLDCLVLKNDIRGIETVKEDAEHVYVKAGAGENWHGFVMYCIG